MVKYSMRKYSELMECIGAKVNRRHLEQLTISAVTMTRFVSACVSPNTRETNTMTPQVKLEMTPMAKPGMRDST